MRFTKRNLPTNHSKTSAPRFMFLRALTIGCLSLAKARPSNVCIREMDSRQEILDVLIVGGGLSGLCIGHGLPENVNWKLLEANQRLGGRLANVNDSTDIDMGGAWVWTDHQPFMKAMIRQLHLATFPQPDETSSTRFVGGAIQIIHALEKEIQKNHGDGRIVLNAVVKSCQQLDNNNGDDASMVEVTTTEGTKYFARNVVLALPPKLGLKTIQFDPPLSTTKQAAMKNSFTWMAGVTKVALVYSHRFWDLDASNAGLPMNGPAFQVYDSSTQDETISSLTFFAHVPPNSDMQSDDSALAQKISEQMSQVWSYYGKSYANLASSYKNFHVHRWPHNPFVSDEREPKRIHPHPMPNRALASPEWDGRLLFAGTESDLGSPGVMEGAVGAAKRVLSLLLSMAKKR